MQFTKYRFKQTVPVVMFLDFEALLIPIEKKVGSATTYYQRHDVSAFCLYTVSIYEPDKQPIVYRGPDAGKVCLRYIEEEIRNTSELYSINEPMTISDVHRRVLLHLSKFCHICEKPFCNDDKVIDHDHATGKIRGVAHNKCNINYKRPNFVPVFVHNLNYDLKFLVKALTSAEGRVDIIPSTEEKYISLMKQCGKLQYRFVDTYRFLQSSLKELVDIQTADTFIHTGKHFPSHLLPLLRRKCVYPYDYMDGWEKYGEKKLPPIEDFYNKMNKETLTKEDYQHAKDVWQTSKVQSLGEYTDLYVKADCLMLADIFEKFRATFIKEYKLDPAWCFTLPGYGLEALLHTTKVQIELLTDINMVYMFQKGIRGGFACCTHKFSEARNKYLGHTLQSGEESKQIILLDCCNLYGYAMSQFLPKDSFRFMSCEEINRLDILNTTDDDYYGYLLEVDLKYPKHLHESHQDLPFCPESQFPPRSKQKKTAGYVTR